ncbi:MAG TPA: FUSC family protein [Tepidisphaeraceae bacterium]
MPPRSLRQSLIAGTYFAVLIGVASGTISLAYAAVERSAGMSWAIISAILVLYPGITQSLSAALLRIAANLLGSAIGFAIGYAIGTGTGEMILALVVTIFVGEILRMDLALRTACVATVIVMSANDHNLTLSVVERVTAVLVGCAAALLVQLAAWPLRNFLPFVADTEATSQRTGKDAARSLD